MAWDMLGMTGEPPVVDWVEDSRVVACPLGGTGFYVGQLCVGGWTFSANFVAAIWLPGWTLAQSGMVHEFAHAMLIETTGNGDGGSDHEAPQGPIWGPDGSVAQINSALANSP